MLAVSSFLAARTQIGLIRDSKTVHVDSRLLFQDVHDPRCVPKVTVVDFEVAGGALRCQVALVVVGKPLSKQSRLRRKFGVIDSQRASNGRSHDVVDLSSVTYSNVRIYKETELCNASYDICRTLVIFS